MPDMMRKTVIITGSSSGIGKACAERFAAEGWNIVAIARRTEKLDELSIMLESKFKIKVFPIAMDVRNQDSGNHLAQLLQINHIQPQLLINNAGLAVGLGPIHEGLADDWERMIDTNLKGLLYISRSVSAIMVDQGFGHIINIGSIAGKESYPNGNVYCATKYAIDGLTKAMRMDLVSHGIKVTQIAPGAVHTEFSDVRFKGNIQRASSVYNGFTPLNATDVADAVYYCANLPLHVNINDLVIMPTAQASAAIIHRQI